ncbi:MAG TPA: hypothetical protein VKT25_07990, partial [Ktedonobacteraceae bacterium]|nr:hypothetical protein [Ktedonobacteraceae bacterium]
SGVDGFQNLSLLGDTDFLIDMALDYDVELNTPGPLTSVNWIEKSIDYLWQKIPQALSKTIFEFPLYGREWRQSVDGQWQHLGEDTCAQVTQQRASQSLLSNVASDPLTPEIAWNDASGSRHELWYNTPESLTGVMAQAQTQVRGLLHDPHYRLPTSFWYRGAECPGFYGQDSALEAFYKDS